MKINKPTYTPGPWKVEGYKFSKRGKSYEYPAAVIAGDIWIASKIGGHDLCDSSMANARLIAAAPEMLEALKYQVNWKMRDGSSCACPAGRDEDEPKGKMPTVHATSCVYLRAAILKAEGK